MTNPRLTSEQLQIANALLTLIREQLDTLTGGDADFRWALRRKIAKELNYDERGKPMQRRRLKALKRAAQNGLCHECQCELPPTYCVLDRFNAIGGYTSENTRLLCQRCDVRIQRERGFS